MLFRSVEIITGITHKSLIKPIGKMVDYIYENSSKIFVSSHSFIDSINCRGVDKSKIEYWPQYAEDFYIPIKKEHSDKVEIPDDGVINFLFAGNIGLAQGLDILPKVAKELKKNKLKVRFNIIGDGRYKNELISQILSRDVFDYFNLIERKEAKEIPYYAAKADFMLISLSSNRIFSMTLPAKTQSCLACGKPILAIGEGELHKLITQSKAGLVSNPNDINKLYENIIEITNMNDIALHEMSVASRVYYDENFDKKLLMNKMNNWLNLGGKYV